MARRILWAVAILEAFVLLVAGCVQVDVPEGPYVVAGERQAEASPKDRERVEGMDKAALQNEVLRLTAENDALRQEVEKQKREIKILKNRIDDLEDQVEDLRDR
jgi:peptidoglycan hydrolase CwlO-like protein